MLVINMDSVLNGNKLSPKEKCEIPGIVCWLKIFPVKITVIVKIS